MIRTCVQKRWCRHGFKLVHCVCFGFVAWCRNCNWASLGCIVQGSIYRVPWDSKASLLHLYFLYGSEETNEMVFCWLSSSTNFTHHDWGFYASMLPCCYVPYLSVVGRRKILKMVCCRVAIWCFGFLKTKLNCSKYSGMERSWHHGSLVHFFVIFDHFRDLKQTLENQLLEPNGFAREAMLRFWHLGGCLAGGWVAQQS